MRKLSCINEKRGVFFLKIMYFRIIPDKKHMLFTKRSISLFYEKQTISKTICTNVVGTCSAYFLAVYVAATTNETGKTSFPIET
jgi:hypothetical protein